MCFDTSWQVCYSRIAWAHWTATVKCIAGDGSERSLGSVATRGSVGCHNVMTWNQRQFFFSQFRVLARTADSPYRRGPELQAVWRTGACGEQLPFCCSNSTNRWLYITGIQCIPGSWYVIFPYTFYHFALSFSGNVLQSFWVSSGGQVTKRQLDDSHVGCITLTQDMMAMPLPRPKSSAALASYVSEFCTILCHLSPLKWHRPALWTMMESFCGSTWWMSRLDCTVSKDFKSHFEHYCCTSEKRWKSQALQRLLKSFDMKCHRIARSIRICQSRQRRPPDKNTHISLWRLGFSFSCSFIAHSRGHKTMENMGIQPRCLHFRVVSLVWTNSSNAKRLKAMFPVQPIWGKIQKARCTLWRAERGKAWTHRCRSGAAQFL